MARAVAIRSGVHHLAEIVHHANPLTPAASTVYRNTLKPRFSGGVEKKIYFIRHGQSESNIARMAKDPKVDTDIRFLDAKLSDHGKKQAAALNTLVDSWGVELVITSPLTRAIQTACLAFGQTQLPIRADPLVTEYFAHLVECQGREVDHIRNESHLLSLPKFNDVCLRHVQPKWWENCDDLTRPDRFLSKISQVPHRSLSVVSHFGTINMFAMHEPSPEVLVTLAFPFPTFGNCDVLETLWLLQPSA
jgi:glucosyl-3-phosphoglycerate phosphatase